MGLPRNLTDLIFTGAYSQAIKMHAYLGKMKADQVDTNCLLWADGPNFKKLSESKVFCPNKEPRVEI